jgi:hypothetical protein
MFGDTQSGQLAYYFYVTLIVSAIVSFVLLRSYRRAVLREMQRQAGESLTRNNAHEPATNDSSRRPVSSQGTSLDFVELRVDSTRTNTSSVQRFRSDPRALRLSVVYSIAGAAHAVVLTIFQFASYTDIEVTAFRFFVMWYANLWLLAPTLALLLARQRSLWRWIAVYLFVGIAVIGSWSAFRRLAYGQADIVPLQNVVSYIQFTIINAGVPALVIALTSMRRLRPVAPVAIAALLVFGFGSLAFQHLLVSMFNLPSIAGGLLEVATWIGTQAVLVALFLLASIPVGYFCWRVLQWISGLYESKAFSDWQLLIDSWYVLWTFEAVQLLASTLGWHSLWALVSFPVFRGIVHAGLKHAQLERIPGANNRLLLLRVFGYQKRTEDLFDRVGNSWRFTGNVQMIAGTDLALRTIDPGDIVAFVAGRLRDLFVKQVSDVGQHLEKLHSLRDPDGRFRVNEVFCTDLAWKPALVGLLHNTDLVLMDLRGFSHGRAGCMFELQQLMRLIPLERVFFIIDHTTDVALLKDTLQAAWEECAYRVSNPDGRKVQLFRLERQTQRALDGLFTALSTAAVATGS